MQRMFKSPWKLSVQTYHHKNSVNNIALFKNDTLDIKAFSLIEMIIVKNALSCIFVRFFLFYFMTCRWVDGARQMTLVGIKRPVCMSAIRQFEYLNTANTIFWWYYNSSLWNVYVHLYNNGKQCTKIQVILSTMLVKTHQI